MQMTAGYNLRAQGTSEFAHMNYPVAACLQQLSLPGTSEPVWILGTRDNQTIVTPRSPGEGPLKEAGRIASYPTDSFTLKLEPYDELDRKQSSAACPSTR